MPNRAGPKADVLQGTLDLIVLQTLDSLGPLHGYAWDWMSGIIHTVLHGEA